MSSSIVANKIKIETQSPITSHTASSQKGLSNIHNNEVNISIWERNLSNVLQNAAAEILNNNPDFKLTIVPKVDEIRDILVDELGSEKILLTSLMIFQSWLLCFVIYLKSIVLGSDWTRSIHQCALDFMRTK